MKTLNKCGKMNLFWSYQNYFYQIFLKIDFIEFSENILNIYERKNN